MPPPDRADDDDDGSVYSQPSAYGRNSMMPRDNRYGHSTPGTLPSPPPARDYRDVNNYGPPTDYPRGEDDYYDEPSTAYGGSPAYRSTSHRQQSPRPLIEAAGYKNRLPAVLAAQQAQHAQQMGDYNYDDGTYGRRNSVHLQDDGGGYHHDNYEARNVEEEEQQQQQFDVYNDFNNYQPPPNRQEVYDYADVDHDANPTEVPPPPDGGYPMRQYSDYTMQDFPQGVKPARAESPPPSIPPLEKRRRCGCPCCGCVSPQVCAIISFIVLVLLGVAIFFCYPRVPDVTFVGTSPVGTPQIGTNPVSFQFAFDLILLVDNSQNYIPFKFNHIDLQVFDQNNPSLRFPIANGTNSFTLQPRIASNVTFPITSNYVPSNASDPTLNNFVEACAPVAADVKRPTLNLRAEIQLFIWGIDWAYRPSITRAFPGLVCPFAQPAR